MNANATAQSQLIAAKSQANYQVSDEAFVLNVDLLIVDTCLMLTEATEDQVENILIKRYKLWYTYMYVI